MLERLRAIIFGNFVIKIFSVIFAVALWLHVVSKGKSEVNFVAPIELKGMPKNMAAVGDVPGYAEVRLQGQEGIIKGTSPKDISVYINLSGAKEGESFFYLGPSDVKVPGNITVISVKPSEVKLRLEKVTRKELRVIPVFSGKPARGYSVGKAKADPELVGVLGPKSLLSKLESVSTRPVDISGASGGFEDLAMVEAPANGVKLEQDSVRVSVSLVKTKR